MKSISIFACFALILVGCGNKPATTPTEADQSEAVSQTAPPATTVPSAFVTTQPAASPQSAKPASESKQVLLGKAFSGDSYNPPHIETKGMQLLAHYGSTSATVTLKNPVTRIIADFKPRPVEDSYPVVFLTVTRTSKGPYFGKKILEKEPILSEGPVSRDVSLEPGTYDVVLGYFGSTKEARTALELRSVTLE
ncbi:hypothetical protein CVU37_12775 [candidate division BRC1 bacterium HGW-BRC1-1]|jgi:hypothetical protein|nr:MAG: hypothetical protein CVU37_12775 [candidate division BRC1 bacterium HGW-BRC1-1]